MDNAWLDRQSFADQINNYFVMLGGDRLPYETTMSSKSIHSVTIGEVKKRLKRIDCSKATHSLDFPSFISRDFADDMAVPITHIINSVFEQQHYPTMYKQSEVIPLPKIPSPSTYKDYRPISLLWHCGKIVEFFFLLRLKPQLLPHLRNDQFAYQQNKGTTDAIIAALDDWTLAIDNKANSGVEVIFEDFSKAFDLMQPSLLHQALVDMNIDTPLINLASSFLSNRMQSVRIGETQSQQKPCTVGVAQGTLSGPWFWLTFSNNFIAPTPITTIRYADDTTCYWPVAKKSAKHHTTSQLAADYSNDWSTRNHMTLNATKTKMMLIATFPDKVTNKSTVTIDEKIVEYVDEMKFLGVTIDSRLNFHSHVTNIVLKACQRQHLMLRLKRNGLSADKLTLFYLANIRSILTYASPSFFSMLCQFQISKMETVQARCTKLILPSIESYTDRLQQLGIPRLTDFMYNLSAKHFNRVALSLDHCLNSRLPRKSTNPRFLNSTRGRTFLVPKSRLTLRENSVIPYFANRF